tara:strand:- start:10177 stop:11508 length:1332 start_codon:yes stop_codon:yes gene_type:complete
MLPTLLLALAPTTFPAPSTSSVTPTSAREDQDQHVIRLDELQTTSLGGQFQRAPHWSMASLVLLSLGPDWHPSGSPFVLEALESPDARVRAYALEALLRTDPKALRAAASTGVVENLVAAQLVVEDELWQAKTMQILSGLFPKSKANDTAGWTQHWEELQRTFTPEEWEEPTGKDRARSSSQSVAQRAMDLYTSGLEVAICIDTTSSMQAMIDTCAIAFDDVVYLLSAVAPDFKIGLVHYKDEGSNPKGGAILNKLSDKTGSVRRKLSSLKVKGGGDIPEAVVDGLEKALSKRMGWSESACKLVLLVGDAPPHKEDRQRGIDLAKAAHEEPFGKKPGEDLGSRGKVRPFVVAGIGVGSILVSQDTRVAFHQMADVAGGSYIDFVTTRREKDPKVAARQLRAELTSGILELVFGSRFREELTVFVNVYFTWTERGLFVAPEEED